MTSSGSSDRLIARLCSHLLHQPVAGERVRDPYEVRLEQELPPGNYRLLVGWYLLSTGQRLPVLDDSGAAVDDKVILPGFVVPESGG